MLKLPKGLKKKKKKSKKDQELFTQEELEEYKRQQKAKQEANTATNKSDVAESDVASEAESLAASTPEVSRKVKTSIPSQTHADSQQAEEVGVSVAAENTTEDQSKTSEDNEEWAKFKALTTGVDTILHKTQDELDRIKKESFYQRLPSKAEKQRQQEEEEAQREAERLAEEARKAAELEAQRDKLAEAVVELSESENEDIADADDIFVTDYIDAITSGEVQLSVVPDSPILTEVDGPDPFDTDYAEKVIVGANKAKSNKKLVSLGAAVEVLSGRVEREKALELSKPKRKQRKGIKNLLLSDSVDIADGEEEIDFIEPQRNLLDELADDVPQPDAPIDLSVSLHLQFVQPKKTDSVEEEVKETTNNIAEQIDVSEFDTLKLTNVDDDDEFAELAAESLSKKEPVKVITELVIPKPELQSEITESDWAEFEQEARELTENIKVKPPRPAPPVKPLTTQNIIVGAIYISDEEESDNKDDDPFNTSYAEQVIKKTTVLEEDDDFDPRGEENIEASTTEINCPLNSSNLAQPTQQDLLASSNTDLANFGVSPITPLKEEPTVLEAEDFDPFDTSTISAIVQVKATELKFIESELLGDGSLKHSLSDPDFDPREGEANIPKEAVVVAQPNIEFNPASRKASLRLNLQPKTVGFLVPQADLLGAVEGGGNKKPLTPYYAAETEAVFAKTVEDPFDTSYVPEVKPTAIELKHLEDDLLTQPATLQTNIEDQNFDPRAPPTPISAEQLLSVTENIPIKVLTPAQEQNTNNFRGGYTSYTDDPFDTSIASDIKPGETELKLLESELLAPGRSDLPTAVLDIQTDAQELGLGDKVLTPQLPRKSPQLEQDIDPFDTSIADNIAPGETEIKLLESEFIGP